MFVQITKNLSVGAEYYETSRSWGHKAHLYLGRSSSGDSNLILKEKVRYYNRTWESYKFESVLKNLYHEARRRSLLSNYHLRLFKKMIDNGGKAEAKRTKRQFKTVAMVAKMGELLTPNQKASNDWKKRMLKAGVSGLIMPDDWSKLSEAEKTKRLDKVINHLKG